MVNFEQLPNAHGLMGNTILLPTAFRSFTLEAGPTIYSSSRGVSVSTWIEPMRTQGCCHLIEASHHS